METAGYLVAGLESRTIQITRQREITTANLIVNIQTLLAEAYPRLGERDL